MCSVSINIVMASSNAAGNPHEVVNHTNASLPKITRNISNAGDVKDPFNILSFSFLLLIISATLFGNILVILAFKRSVKIRTVTNYFVVSLAVADILVALVSMPIWAAFLMQANVLEEGPLVKIWTFMDILCGVASIMNLTAISIERYFCIRYPLNYHTTMTSLKAITIIIIIWIFSIFMSSLKIILWFWPPPNYELMVVISCFFIPLVVMCTTYRYIFKTASYQARQIALMINGNVKNFLLASEMRAAKTLAVVMGAFVISWGPFFILNILFAYCLDCVTTDSVVVAKWMHYTNSLFNPIVYACMNKEFRKAFCIILFGRKRCCRMRKRGAESSTDQTELSPGNHHV